MTPCLLWHRGCVYQLNSRILQSYCKCSYSLPAAKPADFPQMCVPMPPLHIPPLLCLRCSQFFHPALTCAPVDAVSPEAPLLELPSVLYAAVSAIALPLGPTSAPILMNILVTGPSYSCNVFCLSLADCFVSLVSLVLWNSFSKICHILLPVDPPKWSPLTLSYSCPCRVLPLTFRCSPSLAKSPSSIQLFGSTKVRPKALNG